MQISFGKASTDTATHQKKLLFSLSDDSLLLSTWSSYPPFPSSAKINATMIVGRPPLRPPSQFTGRWSGWFRPACLLATGVWSGAPLTAPAPPPPNDSHRHQLVAGSSWKLTTIVGLESPIGLFVQGGRVTILLTIDFHLPQ